MSRNRAESIDKSNNQAGGTAATFTNIYEELIDKLQQNDNSHSDEKEFESFRVKLNKFVAYSYVGQAYDWIIMIVSVVSCLQFIVQSYFPMNDHTSMTFSVFTGLEIVWTVVTAFDILFQHLLVEHKWEYWKR